jgi:GPH family glycoside/pentoside/hexuronide:cation symporter
MVTSASAPAAVTVPRSVRLGYGIGSFCTGTFSTVPGLLLLYYMTNVLAVPALLAGLVVFLPKVWDMIINPYVGQRSDRTVSRFGARRPWLLLGALTLPPTFALTFAGPPLTGIPAALFVGAFFFLTATAYAFFEVPYKAMPTEMTDDYHERSSLLQWRMVFLGLAILLSGAVAPAIAGIEAPGGTAAGYRLMGVVIGLVLLVAMLGTFFGTARAPVVGRAEAEPSLRRQLAVARTNRSFLILLGLSCAQMFAVGTMLAGAPYFATYVLHDAQATTTLFVSLVGPILLTMPLWVWLSKRFEKRGAMALSGTMFAAGAVGMAFTPAFGALYAHLCVLLVGVAYAGLQLLQFSMLADVVAYDQLVTRKRRAGVFTGLWTACETVVFAFGALALSWVLGIAGFVESDPSAPVTQSDAAVQAVLMGGTLLPAVFIALSVVLTLRYPLTAEKLSAAQAVPETTPETTA